VTKPNFCDYDEPKPIRQFDTGATRDLDFTKDDPEGFLSPLVIQRYCEYMSKNRQTAIGIRDSDNWQKGIPKDAYIKSAWRHFLDLWLAHRGYKSREGIEEALCGLMFNVMGYLHELLKPSKDEVIESAKQAIRRADDAMLLAERRAEEILAYQEEIYCDTSTAA